ncbi:Uncharacterized protein TCM_032934 [Theobroma cacao]|uniref:Uncharacterized protein n=1 Tax=Theobroma cacao TaxID=3641 RepID=A0A061F9E5_THECC|nr:Uncharacterized protein TCM_032934 [Theobroma cacao]
MQQEEVGHQGMEAEKVQNKVQKNQNFLGDVAVEKQQNKKLNAQNFLVAENDDLSPCNMREENSISLEDKLQWVVGNSLNVTKRKKSKKTAAKAVQKAEKNSILEKVDSAGARENNRNGKEGNGSSSKEIEFHPSTTGRRKSSSDISYVPETNNCSAESDEDIEERDHVQCLHVHMSFPWLSNHLYASFVYAKCTRMEKRYLWDCLRNISMDMQVSWIAGRDFNTILSSEEQLGLYVPHIGSMEDFATTLLDCGLLNAGFEGNQFTWKNSSLFQRLDRVAYNHEWAESFSIT